MSDFSKLDDIAFTRDADSDTTAELTKLKDLAYVTDICVGDIGVSLFFERN